MAHVWQTGARRRGPEGHQQSDIGDQEAGKGLRRGHRERRVRGEEKSKCEEKRSGGLGA